MSLHPVIAARTTVSVAPTDTVLVAAFRPTRRVLSVEVVNDDATQTLAAWLEVSSDSAGPWSRVADLGLEAVVAGDAGYGKADVSAVPWCQVVGTMDGAGGDVRVSAWQVEP